jgi:hypothetical protein
LYGPVFGKEEKAMYEFDLRLVELLLVEPNKEVLELDVVVVGVAPKRALGVELELELEIALRLGVELEPVLKLMLEPLFEFI